MLIIALVLAVVSLAALVTAVVTSNETIAWVCIGLSALGVLLLIADAIRDRHRRPVAVGSDRTEVMAPVGATEVIEPVSAIESVDDSVGVTEVIEPVADYPDIDEDIPLDDDIRLEDHPEEVLHDEPDFDSLGDDEPEYPVAAEEAAVHIVTADDESADIDESATGSRDDSFTVIYAGEPYTDASETVTDSYIVVTTEESDESGTVTGDESGTDEGDTAADSGEGRTVIYAEKIDDDDSDRSEEHRESDSER